MDQSENLARCKALSVMPPNIINKREQIKHTGFLESTLIRWNRLRMNRTHASTSFGSFGLRALVSRIYSLLSPYSQIHMPEQLLSIIASTCVEGLIERGEIQNLTTEPKLRPKNIVDYEKGETLMRTVARSDAS